LLFIYLDTDNTLLVSLYTNVKSCQLKTTCFDGYAFSIFAVSVALLKSCLMVFCADWQSSQQGDSYFE